MKITELKCSACDGTLKIDENNPGYAECEYCHTRYTIEWEKPTGHVASGEREAHLTQVSAPTNIPKIEYQKIPDEVIKKQRTGWEYDGWKRLTLCMVVLVAVIAIWRGPAIIQRYQMDHPSSTSTSGKNSGSSSNLSVPTQPAVNPLQSASESGLKGILADFLEEVFDKPIEDITASELSKIAWLEMKSTMDYREVGYSFENPLDNPDAELTWVKFSRNDYSNISLSGLNALSGLKVIGVGQSLQSSQVAGLELEGIKGYFSSLEEVVSLVEKPELIRMVDMTGSPSSLQGLDSLPGLEDLTIDADVIEESKMFASAASLKRLSLDMYDGSMDFSVFGVMTNLETLEIYSKNLRDISFVAKMDSLKSLKLKYGDFLSVEALNGLTGLEELSLLSCDNISDLTPVESLTGLKKLTVELPYGCKTPNLENLTELEVLYLDGFSEMSFLRGMTNLQELTLDGCHAKTPADFTGLVNLRTLRCTTFGYMEQDYSFVTELPAIEHVDLHGTITYGDITGIFNLPTLKSLDISNMQCGIDFSKIAGNTTLEELSIDDMTIYTNVSISGGGGIYSIDWDPVSLTDNLDFLEKLTGLKKLSIRENDLTDLSFVTLMPGLESIDFGDNYVTDLSPLSGLRALKEINCEDNPISNYEVISGSIRVLK